MGVSLGVLVDYSVFEKNLGLRIGHFVGAGKLKIVPRTGTAPRRERVT